MRLVDEHRATEHRLAVPVEETQRRLPTGTQAEYRRLARERAERIVPHLASRRVFDPAPHAPDPERLARLADEERRAALVDYAARAARNPTAVRRATRQAKAAKRQAEVSRAMADLRALMWSQAG